MYSFQLWGAKLQTQYTRSRYLQTRWRRKRTCKYFRWNSRSNMWCHRSDLIKFLCRCAKQPCRRWSRYTAMLVRKCGMTSPKGTYHKTSARSYTLLTLTSFLKIDRMTSFIFAFYVRLEAILYKMDELRATGQVLPTAGAYLITCHFV